MFVKTLLILCSIFKNTYMNAQNISEVFGNTQEKTYIFPKQSESLIVKYIHLMVWIRIECALHSKNFMKYEMLISFILLFVLV